MKLIYLDTCTSDLFILTTVWKFIVWIIITIIYFPADDELVFLFYFNLFIDASKGDVINILYFSWYMWASFPVVKKIWVMV